MFEEFKDKRVLITGASKGLGWVCAQYFEKWGSQLIITGRIPEKLKELQGEFSDPSRHLSVVADLINPEEIKRLVNEGKEFLGGIDIIIHALGGGYGFKDPLLSWEQFTMLHQVNFSAAAEINRLLIPEMSQRQAGNVIHICSVSSQEATGSVGYNTIKAALAGYVRSLGREMAESGVVITGILPGAFYAPGNSWRRLDSQKPEVVQQFIDERLPRKKIAEADELIPLIALLAGQGASMMAGSCVPIDAGEGIAYSTT